MRKLILLAMVSFSVVPLVIAGECPDLTGIYTCFDGEEGIVLATKVDGVVTSYEIIITSGEYSDDPQTVIPDGIRKEHPEGPGYFRTTYCSENKLYTEEGALDEFEEPTLLTSYSNTEHPQTGLLITISVPEIHSSMTTFCERITSSEES